MVRLKVILSGQHASRMPKFQFQNGSIKSSNDMFSKEIPEEVSIPKWFD